MQQGKIIFRNCEDSEEVRLQLNPEAIKTSLKQLRQAKEKKPMPVLNFFKIEFLNEDDMNQYIDDYLENDYPGYTVYQMYFDTVKSRYVLLLQLTKRI